MSSTASDSGKDIVLVVDDDSDICVALEMLLEYEGFTVWTAKNGRMALARLEAEAERGKRPVAIFSDVKMPGMDGMNFLEEVQSREDPPPVLMISGHGDIETAVEAV
ncbi:MAG TPA: response regulator, partial [Planctomycetes bacterium]|nr:response regulator [Planctomycetota bacterium]